MARRRGTGRKLAILAAIAVGGVVLALRPGEVEAEEIAELRERLRSLVAERVASGALARPAAEGEAAGHAYAIDLASLQLAAARAEDRTLYDALRAIARDRLIVDAPDDPFVHRMVAWRAVLSDAGDGAAAEADASGTTEALRLAEALWAGASAFDAPQDAELAREILAAYARHATTDRGVWLVRNYLNLRTRAFATNSYLVDYAPDFVAAVAEASGDAELAALAERSYGVIDRAVTDAGLLYGAIAPELATLQPDLDTVFHGPNDTVQLSNAAAAAAASARGRPRIAQGVLEFAAKRRADLRLAYLGRSGRAVPNAPRAGLTADAALARLACALGDRRRARVFGARLASGLEDWLEAPSEPVLHVAAEAWLALQDLERLLAVPPPQGASAG